MNMSSLIVGTKTKFSKLKPQVTQVRIRDSFGKRDQLCAYATVKCGVATKLVMTEGDVGKQCEAMSARLAHGIHGNALSLCLRLRIVLIRWLSQLKNRKRNAFLRKFSIEKIRRVHGISIHGCLDTNTMINRYNRAPMTKVQQDLRAWFSAIAPCRIHADSKLTILKA